jgi:site-specific DNA recombinase
MTSTTTRAAIYCRISEDQDDEQLGVERQRRDCLRLVESNGWTVVPDGSSDTFTDNDIPGDRDATERAGFGRLVAAMRAGKVDVLVAFKQARVYRHTVRFLLFCDEAKEAGVQRLVFVADTDVDLGGSMFVPTVIAAKDAEDRRLIGELVRRKKDELAEKGKPAGGGIRAFGYNWPHRIKGTGGRERYVEPDGEAEPYSVYEPEARAIHWAYDHLLNGDGTIAGVQREWTDRGLSTIRGSVRADGAPAWNRKSIRTTLVSPRVAGLREHRGVVVGPASWEGIVTKERWEAMCALLNDPLRANRPHTPANRRYPLRGLLLCGVCGRKMTGTIRNKARGSARYYHCRKDAGGCINGGAWVKADNLEAWVIGLVVGVAESSDALDMIQAECGVLADELRALVARRDDMQGKLDRLEIKWAKETISEEPYLQSRKDFQKAISAAEDRITAIQASSALGQVEGNLLTAWGKLNPQEQRKIIVSLVAEIRVAPRATKGGNRFDPRRARIVWRSSALAMAAGMDEWPWSDEPLGRDEAPDADRFYCPEVVKQATAMCVAFNNVTDAKVEGVEVPAFVEDVISTIHD